MDVVVVVIAVVVVCLHFPIFSEIKLKKISIKIKSIRDSEEKIRNF